MTTKTVTTIEAEPTTGGGTGTVRPRHIVALDAAGQPTERCLCGYLWDRVHVPHNGSICQVCVDELEKIQRARRGPA